MVISLLKDNITILNKPNEKISITLLCYTDFLNPKFTYI